MEQSHLIQGQHVSFSCLFHLHITYANRACTSHPLKNISKNKTKQNKHTFYQQLAFKSYSNNTTVCYFFLFIQLVMLIGSSVLQIFIWTTLNIVFN